MQALAMQALPIILKNADKIPAIANVAGYAIDSAKNAISNFANNVLGSNDSRRY
jgi:Sec-independent protein translocase protein TatA